MILVMMIITTQILLRKFLQGLLLSWIIDLFWLNMVLVVFICFQELR